MQGRDAGLQIASGLANDGDMNSSPDEMINDIGAGLADSFIRQPTQLLNFGTVIDTDPSAGADCIEAWDSAHEDKKGNDKDTLKDNHRRLRRIRCERHEGLRRQPWTSPGHWRD